MNPTQEKLCRRILSDINSDLCGIARVDGEIRRDKFETRRTNVEVTLLLSDANKRESRIYIGPRGSVHSEACDKRRQSYEDAVNACYKVFWKAHSNF